MRFLGYLATSAALFAITVGFLALVDALPDTAVSEDAYGGMESFVNISSEAPVRIVAESIDMDVRVNNPLSRCATQSRLCWGRKARCLFSGTPRTCRLSTIRHTKPLTISKNCRQETLSASIRGAGSTAIALRVCDLQTPPKMW